MKRLILFLFITALISIAASADLLAPGATKTYTAQYTVKDTDICKDISTLATVTAKDPCSTIVEDDATAIVRVIYNADIDFQKASDKSGEKVDAGDIITYTFRAKNTGEVDLTDVSLVDKMVETIELESGDANGDERLNPGEEWTYKGTYQVKEEDLCHKIVNWAELTAKDPCNKLITKKAHDEVEAICIECCQDRMNKEDIDAGNQMAMGFHNGEAKNNVKIVTGQRGSD